MSSDPEITAMSAIVAALEDLEEAQVARVLHWAQQRYTAAQPAVAEPRRSEGAVPNDVEESPCPPGFAEFYDLFEAASPDTGLDRALVAGYWLQVEKGQETFGSGPLNRELKHLGYPASNITRDLGRLMNRTPKLVMKVRKEGSARQSRNRYKLTSSGIDAVSQMLGKS
ncbi:MAG: hypothetical protein F4151_00530 [Gammaproteobacteria bacterium]|nr:hypothetical protein [Gammaproteobacteria bacterium]